VNACLIGLIEALSDFISAFVNLLKLTRF